MSEEKEPTVGGISAHEFNMWKHHPVTQMMYKYYGDMVVVLERVIMDDFYRGSLTPLLEKEVRGRLLTLRELQELEHDHVVKFYEQEKEQDGTESDDQR